MVAIINTSSDISRTLNYNEQKCKQGAAEILYASRFIKEAKDLNFYEKLRTFKQRNALNERTKVNTLHVSLNFDPSEKLSNEKLVNIAKDYMEKIGFADQPFLVYEHHDAGHPHVHIVSTNIKTDGKAITFHNLGKDKSEPARKALEEEYKLVKAERQQQVDKHLFQGILARKLQYGKMPVKNNINAVLNEVIRHYKFSSLPELNAVLELYNVRADRGEKGSRMHDKKGLVYRVIDDKGNPQGPPIKASRFSLRPTLAYLEKQFEKNRLLKDPFKGNFRQKLDHSLTSHPLSIEAWLKALQQQNISVVTRINGQGILYGMTYVDHKTKTVFKGSDLGSDYSANAIANYFKKGTAQSSTINETEWDKTALHISNDKGYHNLLDILLKPEWQPDYTPFQLKRKRKRRKRTI